MPVRNGARHLSEAIESILTQTLSDFEFVIVDDGSTDETPVLLEQYARQDARIVTHRTGPGGVVAALNRGCRLARGRFIARMDADDVAFPERLERQLAYLTQRPHMALLGTGFTEIADNGTVLGTTAYPSSPEAVAARLPVKNCIAHPTVVFARAVFEATGGYRSALRHCEDYDLWLRIADHHPIANLEEPLLAYRVHPKSVSLGNTRQQVLSMLAAQAATRIRRSGGEDKLGSLQLVTVEVLEKLGLTREQIERNVFASCAGGAERALALGYNKIALDLSLAAASCAPALPLTRAERAHVHRIAAIAAFRARRPVRGALALAAGVAARPSLAGRALRRAARTVSRRPV